MGLLQTECGGTITNEEIKQRMGVAKDTVDFTEEKRVIRIERVRWSGPKRWTRKVTEWSLATENMEKEDVWGDEWREVGMNESGNIGMNGDID